MDLKKPHKVSFTVVLTKEQRMAIRSLYPKSVNYIDRAMTTWAQQHVDKLLELAVYTHQSYLQSLKDEGGPKD